MRAGALGVGYVVALLYYSPFVVVAMWCVPLLPLFDCVHEFVLFAYHQACARGCWGMVVRSPYPQRAFVGQAVVPPLFWQEVWWSGALCYFVMGSASLGSSGCG